jgi:ATP phosphoribosyltransferase
MTTSPTVLKLALPKGRMQQGVFALMNEAGISIHHGGRSYRPTLSVEGIDTKILKPQNIVEMLHIGSRDLGFAGADWVAELGAELVEILDLELDPVQVVAAAPAFLLEDGALPDRPLIIASEYQNITRQWIADKQLDAQLLRTYGATEVFPPEDADCIVDNTATGSTLRANNLQIVDVLMHSSTRFYAHPRALDDPKKRGVIEDLTLVLKSVLAARKRVMIELNVAADRLDALVHMIPCMRQPTVSQLHSNAGYAIKAAVQRDALAKLIPELKAAGGSDIVVSNIAQIVP